MMDPIIASRIAKMEHEERARAIVRQEQFDHDVVPEDYDAWLTGQTAPGTHLPLITDMISLVGSGVTALVNKLRSEPEPAADKSVGRQHRGSAVG